MELRYYQRAAVDATYNYLNMQTGNPCIVIPTGGGKTAVMATFCLDVAGKWGGRVLVLSHVKELIEQTVDTLSRIAPGLSIGVYSAGLKSRDTENQVICAGIQSVYQKADELGRFDLILVDEAHLIPPDGDGMYQTFLKAAMTINNRARLVGLTATPYRLKSGAICGKDNLLNSISYEVSVKELIENGYLSHITSKGGTKKVDVSNLRIVRGDFDLSRIDEIMDNDYLLSAVVEDIKERASDRQSILVFCPSIATCERFCKRYKAATGSTAFMITGDTPADKREEYIKRFKGTNEPDLFGNKEEPIRVLANVNVLTTGFDAPNVDCVVMLRPTASPGLYYQQVGRGFRIAPGKTDCLVLDYVGNIMRHGCIDIITPPNAGKEKHESRPPIKECPECNAIIHAAFKTCPECGYEFPARDSSTKWDSKASNASILSGEKEETEYQVFDTIYSIHDKEKEDGTVSHSIKIEYRVALHLFKKDFIFPESMNPYARKKFVDFWNARVCPELQSTRITPPTTCQEFMDYANWGCLAEPEQITVTKIPGDKYPRVTDCKLKEIPSYESIQRKIDEAQNAPVNDFCDNYQTYYNYDNYGS